jgi:hypothetical protein
VRSSLRRLASSPGAPLGAPAGCFLRQVRRDVCQGGRLARCTRGALYGAYGPWGGRGYWDAFTATY